MLENLQNQPNLWYNRYGNKNITGTKEYLALSILVLLRFMKTIKMPSEHIVMCYVYVPFQQLISDSLFAFLFLFSVVLHCGRRYNKRYDSTSLLLNTLQLIYKDCTRVIQYTNWFDRQLNQGCSQASTGLPPSFEERSEV
jgi:hypothetical protein